MDGYLELLISLNIAVSWFSVFCAAADFTKASLFQELLFEISEMINIFNFFFFSLQSIQFKLMAKYLGSTFLTQVFLHLMKLAM